MQCMLSLYEKSMPNEISWKEKLTASQKAGFDALEISIDESEEKLSRLDWSKQERKKLLTLTREIGLHINTMCLSGHRKYPLGSNDPEIEARGMKIMKQAIELAYDLGIRIIQLAGYDVYYESSNADTQARFGENLVRAVHMAEKRGVILAFETMETPFMNTIEKAMRYVYAVNSPYLQVYPDIGNISNGTEDIVADIVTGKGHIVAAHLKETRPGVFRDLHYGEGNVDFSTAVSVLKQQGVGLYNAEFWYEPSYKKGNWRGALREAHDFLRPYLK